ncbi:MAG: Flp pilus assembly complex ATPase component TadA [Phycisphaeraceae bacterium]|nr:Flp pilus assembly complex ATPase component TadA [Phycisphaeraceae bacterium]
MGIGLVLLDRGLITKRDLDRAIAEQQASGDRLDKVLVRLGLISREQVLEAIGDQFHMPVVDLTNVKVDESVLRALPTKLVYRQNCAPIGLRGDALTVATSDPFELSILDELRLLAGRTIDLVLADEQQLQEFIRANYGVGGGTLDELAETISAPDSVQASDSELDEAQEASVIKLVNDLLIEAISERATDVHIEPYEHELAVRYRIDGVLHRANIPSSINRFRAAIVSRIKIMASLNIAEKRIPQDGRITLRHRVDGRPQEFDLRVSVIPMLFGEGVVLRVLNKASVLLGLDDLGMSGRVMERWGRLIDRPHGILLVTGPTGSGKSTTLYASLNSVRSDEVKMITVEDPVEYHIPGVNQIQIAPKVGLTFATGLRSVLRHDPDVVMIGEIRDKETADIAVQASLTGHLVLSTLHTNDAAGATTRLLDMGVEPFLVASSVEGILAQRLVRKVCPNCSESYEPDPTEMPADFEPGQSRTLVHGRGCRQCRDTGFRGRIGVFELLLLSDPVREMVMRRANAREIASRALADDDLNLLRHDGYDKVRAGLTTMPEVVRALAT